VSKRKSGLVPYIMSCFMESPAALGVCVRGALGTPLAQCSVVEADLDIHNHV